jgi:hypothetical protein
MVASRVARHGSGLLAIVALALTACAPPAAVQSAPARYLFVWAGPHTAHANPSDTAHHAASDFIAVLDADSASSTYGRVLTTIPVDRAGAMAHHIEYSLSERGGMFANDFATGRVFVFDLTDPGAPRFTGMADTVAGYRKPHTFARLANGNVLVTFQFGDGATPGDPGGLAEFDATGRLIRVASSADPAFAGARIRTYGLEVLPAIDRAVTTSSPMDNEVAADVIQLWRISDLKLLRTITVPKVEGDSLQRYPFEIRVLSDGRTAMMNSYYCGFYHLTGLDTENPRVELVHAMRNPVRIGCSVPTRIGRYHVIPIAYAHKIVSLDVSNPTKPVEVSVLATDTTFFPHWSSADPTTNRIVLTEQGDGEARILIVKLDPATGRLSWDERFKEPESNRRGIAFDRPSWPHGAVGAVMPHGAVFSRAPE